MFSQTLGKIKKRSHNFRDSARLHITFTDVTRGNRFDRPGDQRNAEQECNFKQAREEELSLCNGNFFNSTQHNLY